MLLDSGIRRQRPDCRRAGAIRNRETHRTIGFMTEGMRSRRGDYKIRLRRLNELSKRAQPIIVHAVDRQRQDGLASARNNDRSSTAEFSQPTLDCNVLGLSD
jgi:hypothetical protein